MTREDRERAQRRAESRRGWEQDWIEGTRPQTGSHSVADPDSTELSSLAEQYHGPICGRSSSSRYAGVAGTVSTAFG